MKHINSSFLALLFAAFAAGAAAAQPAEDYARRGMGCFRGADYDCAVINLQKALEMNPYLEERLMPVLAKAYARRGVSYYRAGEYAKAVADFDESLRADPSQEDVRKARDFASRALKNPPRRPAPPEKEIPQDPPTPLINKIGMVLLIAGAAVSLWMFWKVDRAAREKKRKLRR